MLVLTAVQLSFIFTIQPLILFRLNTLSTPAKIIRTLTVTFDQPLAAEELTYFRAAVVEKVGVDKEYFHNHNNTEGNEGYHYRYPLVQYTRFKGLPAILFVEGAVEQAKHFFALSDWALQLKAREYEASVGDLRARQLKIGVTPGVMREYRLHKWIALNDENFQRYQGLPTMTEKIELLERVLAGQLLALATGLGVKFEERFELRLSDLSNRRLVPYKGVKLMTFDVRFRAELILPPGLGVGKGSALGFGRLWQFKENGEVSSAQKISNG